MTRGEQIEIFRTNPGARGKALQHIRDRFGHQDIFCVKVLDQNTGNLIWIVARETGQEESPVYGVGVSEAEALMHALETPVVTEV